MKSLREPENIRALSLFLLFSCVAAAQDNWIQITTVRVKPDMIDKWRGIYKNEIVPAYKKARLPSFAVWRNSPFGDTYEFTLVTPIGKFAQFDAMSPLTKVMKTADRLRVEAELNRCVAGAFSVALLSQPDISVVKEGAVAPPLIMVQTVTLAPKNVNAYLAFLKEEMKPVIQKAGVDVWLVYRHVFGSEGNQITTIRSMSGYAELDAGPLTSRILGPDEAVRLGAKGNQFLDSSRIVVAQYDKEISYGRISEPASSGVSRAQPAHPNLPD